MTGEGTSRDGDGKVSTATTPRSNSDRSNSRRRHARAVDIKAVYETLKAVRAKIKGFKKSHLGAMSKFDFVKCLKCLEEDILPEWKMIPEDIKDYEFFWHFTLTKKIDEDVMASDEYIDLMSIANRAYEFEAVVPDVKRRLKSCLDNIVSKSCVSLKEMTGNEIIIAVSEYENDIHEHKAKIQAKKDEIEQHYSAYKQLLRPFSFYVKEGKEHAANMNRVCNKLLELCKLIEDWVKEDEEYPDKLEDEYEANKKIKENIRQSLEKTKAKKRRNRKMIEKIKKSETAAGRGYAEHKKDKQKFKLRKEHLERKREMLEDKIERKREERDNLKEERESGPKTRNGSDDFLERLENVEVDIETLEKERKATAKQIKAVEKELKPANEKTYEHKVDGVTYRHRREDLEKENLKLDEEIASIKQRMANVDTTNQTLMKVREMKLSVEAYKKNMRAKLREEALQLDGRKELDDACKHAAPGIGKDWPRVYLGLPFDPPRDLEKKKKDVETLDYIFGRNDVTEEEQAVKSLAKWRDYNRRGNIRELIDTLYSTKKRHVAKDLEEMFCRSE